VESTPELKAFVETVSKHASGVTKEQLYPQIETTKDKYNKLAEEHKHIITAADKIRQAQLEDELRHNEEQERLRAENEQLRNLNANANVEEMMNNMLNRFETTLRAALPTYKTSAELQQEAADVNAYRQAAIAANTGTIIPELVIGNTKAEIDASVLKSKAAYAAYNGLPTPVATPVQQEPTQQPVMPVPVAPVAPTQAAPVVAQPVKRDVLAEQQEAMTVKPAHVPQEVWDAAMGMNTTQPAQQVAQPVAPVAAPQVEEQAPAPLKVQRVIDEDMPDIASMSQEEFNQNHEALGARVRAIAESLGR
jgi:hypothetical protein